MLAQKRAESLSNQQIRVQQHEKLANQMRRLDSDIVSRLNDRIERCQHQLDVENAIRRLTDIEVGNLVVRMICWFPIFHYVGGGDLSHKLSVFF